MVLLGTILNTISVAVGSSLGLFSGKLISSKAQTNIITIFGLFTLAISIDMMGHMNEPINVFLALVIGALIGGSLKLHERFTAFVSRFDNGNSLATGFIKASMLFCVGGMTIIGCMNEGIGGDYNLIMIKSCMDLISSFFLAAALGRGVLLSAVGVFIIQGSLTLGFHCIGQFLLFDLSGLISDLTATGGILLLALGLDLVGIKKFQMLDLIPALALLPIIHYLHLLIV
jgi:hypothetical protein